MQFFTLARKAGSGQDMTRGELLQLAKEALEMAQSVDHKENATEYTTAQLAIEDIVANPREENMG